MPDDSTPKLVRRVTLVVNNADEGSETFLQAIPAALAPAGIRFTIHPLLSGRTSAATRRTAESLVAETSVALPQVRSWRFAPAFLALALRSPWAVLLVTVRSVRHSSGLGRRIRAVALAAPIMATRPDVVHLAFSGIGLALLDAIPLLGPARVIVSCRGSGELVKPVLDPSVSTPLRRLFRSVDVVHCVADAVADAAIELGVERDRIVVIRPAVDVDRFAPVDERPDTSRLSVITVGRLHWIKSHADLLDAIAILRRRAVDIHLTIVGDGPERDHLRYRAHALGLDDVVSMVGSLPHDDVRALVAGSDLLVSSSLSEGISNAVLEAMALEVPVVATSVGGMRELLSSPEVGTLVAPGSPEDLAAALESMRLAQRRVEMGRQGRRRVVEQFSASRQAEQLAALYVGPP